jgi:hypothetical protein
LPRVDRTLNMPLAPVGLRWAASPRSSRSMSPPPQPPACRATTSSSTAALKLAHSTAT